MHTAAPAFRRGDPDPGAPTSVDLLAALLHPEPGGSARPAVATRTADGWEEWTYHDLDRRCTTVAARLGAHGVAPGDRVVLSGPTGGPWLAALLGIIRVGAIANPVDPRLTPAELGPIVARTAPTAMVAPLGGQAPLGGVAPGNPGTPPFVDLDALTLDGQSADGFGAGMADSFVAPARQSHDPALVVWTSGTTGAPKGVTLSYANLAYGVGRSIAAQGADAERRWLSVLPAHHLLELCCGVLPALATGAPVCFAGTLLPQEIAQIITERQLDTMVAVPLLLRILEPAVAGSGLQTVYSGGAALDPPLIDRFAALGVAVYQGYGLTEAAPTVSMNTPSHHRFGSVGRPLDGTEVRIDAPVGRREGEIVVRSPAVMLGYWGDEDLTASVVDDDGWLRTGDLGYLDDDGFLYVTGRAKRLVVLESGKNVQPEEVEQTLDASDLFAEVCVVAVAGGPVGAEQVCAVVVPRPSLVARHQDPPALQEEVAAEVARRTAALSGYKRPTVVVVFSEPLPRTLKGTVRHGEVAAMLDRRRRSVRS